MLKIHYVFLLLVGVVLCLALFLMADASHRELLIGRDFRGTFTGPYMIAHGAWSHLHELQAQLFWQQQYVPEAHSLKALLPFLNPVFVALVLFPLTYLSFTSAYVVWGMVNIVLFGLIFFWCFWLLREELQNAEGAHTPLFLLIFSWIPFWVAIMQGQPSLILVASLVFFAELIVFRSLLSTRGNAGWVEKYVPFWGYIFVAVQMVALWALLPLSAVTASILLVCTLYLLYFEYRSEMAIF